MLISGDISVILSMQVFYFHMLPAKLAQASLLPICFSFIINFVSHKLADSQDGFAFGGVMRSDEIMSLSVVSLCSPVHLHPAGRVFCEIVGCPFLALLPFLAPWTHTPHSLSHDLSISHRDSVS